ncbi:replication protein A 70 kDa DNA-binding subunit B [Tanacetum coccineum]
MGYQKATPSSTYSLKKNEATRGSGRSGSSQSYWGSKNVGSSGGSGGNEREKKITPISQVDPMLDDICIQARCISIWHSHRMNAAHDPYNLDLVLQDVHCTTVTRIEPFDQNTNGFILEPFNYLLDTEHNEYYENDDVGVIGSVVGIGDIVPVMSATGKKIRRTIVVEDAEVQEREGYDANQVKIELFSPEVKVVTIGEFFHGAINRTVGTIRDSDPGTHCIVYARIHKIHKEHGWAYPGCKNCNKRVDILPRQNCPPVYVCEDHGNVQPASRFKVILRIIDKTEDMELINHFKKNCSDTEFEDEETTDEFAETNIVAKNNTIDDNNVENELEVPKESK